MNIAGLGVRVRPSCSRTFICHRKTVRGIKKLSWGPAALRKVEDVRRDCLAAETVEANEDTHRSVPLFRDFVAGPWKGACFDRCKPSTQRGFRHMLKRRLLSSRPDYPQHDAGLVRELQQKRPGKCQQDAGSVQTDTQSCHRLRPYRSQPDARHRLQSPPEDHPLPVARRNQPGDQHAEHRGGHRNAAEYREQ